MVGVMFACFVGVWCGLFSCGCLRVVISLLLLFDLGLLVDCCIFC